MARERSFKALLLEETDGEVSASIETLDDDALPDGEVTVRVAYSDLNYKDGLALTGQGQIVRRYPMVPGMDFAGTVEASQSGDFKAGDKVVATGWGLSVSHWGGYAQKARVPADWLVPLPDGLTEKQAMAIGTAGFTSMLCVMELERNGLEPGDGEVVVTGAAGGVGSIAVAILAKLGYAVAAVTGRAETHDYLTSLGARTIVDGAELLEGPAKPLLSQRWAGAVDVAGGDLLARILSAMRRDSCVAACGLAGSAALNTTVLPFILRGVKLLGVNILIRSGAKRRAAWQRLAEDLPLDALDRMTEVVPLAKVPELAGPILEGQVRGRVVVDVNA